MLLQYGAAFLYYKTGQVELQTRAGIKKGGNFYYKVGQVLHSKTDFITKLGRYWMWGNHYKIV